MIRRTIPVILGFIAILYLVQGQDSTRIPKGLTKPPFATQYDTAQAVTKLKQNLDALFSTRRYRRSDVSVMVRSLTRGVTLYERNARKPLTPASNTKLFSTNAVFYALGNEGANGRTYGTGGNAKRRPVPGGPRGCDALCE